MLNAQVVATGEGLEGNYCYLHLAELDRLTPPGSRSGWKREYLRRSLKDRMCPCLECFVPRCRFARAAANRDEIWGSMPCLLMENRGSRRRHSR